MVELRQLRILVAAADCGSFSSAALRLNIEVSAVSRAIREVEEELRTRLFDRLPRGSRLTRAGSVYVKSARDVLQRIDRAAVDARNAGEGRSLHLTVGFLWSAASQPMVKLLRTFASDHPITVVEIVEAANDDLISRLNSGLIDVAVAATDPPLLSPSKELGPLTALPLWPERLVAIAPAAVERTAVSWTDLTEVRLLCRTLDDWPRLTRRVEQLGGPTLVFEPHAVSQEGVLGLVAAGLGWTLLAESLCHLLPMDVQALDIASAGATVQIEAVWCPENSNPALKSFLASCRQLFHHEKVAVASL